MFSVHSPEKKKREIDQERGSCVFLGLRPKLGGSSKGSTLCGWLLRVVVTTLHEERQAQMEMARRPSEVVIYVLTLKRLTSSVILVGGRSAMMACVWRRELVVGSMDIHTCADTTRPQISDVGLEGHEKGRFGEGPTNCDKRIAQVSEGSATSGWAEVFPFSCGGDTAELLNEAVRWPFTSVLREWRTKGKGFQKLLDKREAFTHRFGRQLLFS